MKIKVKVPSHSSIPSQFHDQCIDVGVSQVLLPDGQVWFVQPTDIESESVTGGLPAIMGQKLKTMTVEFQ